MRKFIMLCGLPGSGKSTVAEELKAKGSEDTVIVSSDAIRKELWGSEEDQQNPAEVFQVMRETTIEYLQENFTVIYDATNLSSKRRAALLGLLKTRFPELETELHIIVATPEQCISNQKNRERKVPEEVIIQKAKQFQLPTLLETWDKVWTINKFPRVSLYDLVKKTKGVSQTSKYHLETVDKHQEMAGVYAVHHGFDIEISTAAYIHDIGKPLCREVDEEGQTHFYGHANVSALLYLCTLFSCELKGEVKHISQLIEHHMDLMMGVPDSTIIKKLGESMLEKLYKLHEADTNSAINESNLKKISLLDFMHAFEDWEIKIQQPPFCVNVKHEGAFVLLKYQQLNSDMSYRLVQESRGSIFTQYGYVPDSVKGPWIVKEPWVYACRPFDKFFNYGEPNAAEIDWSTARVLEKIDGSLMKMFYDVHEKRWRLATNGTIDAFKAQIADTELTFGDLFNRALGYDFKELGEKLDKDYTYMFELTSPDNLLVVPYEDGVWYLSRRDTLTGEEDFTRLELPNVKLPKQYNLDSLDEVLKVVQAMSKEEEGVVVNDAYSNRVKIKSPEYLIAAHLDNNKMVSNHNLVTYMKNGTLDDFLAYCPRYVERVSEMTEKFKSLCSSYEEDWEKVKEYISENRKEFAKQALMYNSKAYLFAKYDNPQIKASDFLLSQTSDCILRLLKIKVEVNK